MGLVAITVSIPLIAATGLWQAAVHGFGNQRVLAFQGAIFATPDICPIVTGLSASAVRECTWNEGARGRPIYLLGDSNAGQFIDAVALAGADLNRPVIASTTNSCPFLDVHVERLHQPDSWNAYCRAYTRESLHFLSSATAGTVIISNIDTYWEDPAVAIVTSNGTPSVRLSDKYAALEEGMGAMVENLESAGHDVVVVQTIPRWSEADTWRTASCTVPQILEDGCRQTMRRQDALDRQGNVRRTIADATSHTGGADPRHLGGALPGKGKPVFDTRQRPTALLPRWASRLSHRGAIPSTVVPGDS